MQALKRKGLFIGFLLIIGIISGLLSVTPAVDSGLYLTEANTSFTQVIFAAISQSIMAFVYIVVGLLFYALLKDYGTIVAIGFLIFRIISAILVILGILFLLSILALSQNYGNDISANIETYELIGNTLKTSRDYINHIFMVISICTANILMYTLLIKSKLIPKWLSLWGIFAAVLSILASLLLLFQIVPIISSEYLILNAPTALFELFLGIWLLTKGFKKNIII